MALFLTIQPFFSTALPRIDKTILPPIKISFYHEANWDFINSSLSNQLAIWQDQTSNLINVDNPDPINIISNAAIILTDTTTDIHNHLPEKTIKPNSCIPFNIQLLIKQKRKIKRTFIKTRNPFLKKT